MEASQTSTKNLRGTLQEYEQLIAGFNQPGQITDQAILEILLVRDRLQAQLQEDSITAEDLLRLDELDHQLKQGQATIQKHAKLPRWRETYHPQASAWWWAVEPEVKVIPASRYDGLWNSLALIFLAGAASLILNTASRFWKDGVASAGTLAVVAQSVLALVVGKGALTASGRKGWENLLKQRGIPEYHWQEWSCGAAGGVLLLAGGIHASLPWVATWYNDWGRADYLDNYLASALDDYQVAINLRPDYPEAHYNLGILYEDLQQAEDAIAAYRFVVERDVESVDELIWLQANNNLARLYILQDETRDAVPLLIQSLAAIPADAVATRPDLAKINYSLLKNLGWARLEQARYGEAETQLDEAIRLLEGTISPDTVVRNRGSGYCLMAQVLDAQERIEEADRRWETCLIEANAGNPDEDTWIGVYERRSPSSVPTDSGEVAE